MKFIDKICENFFSALCAIAYIRAQFSLLSNKVQDFHYLIPQSIFFFYSWMQAPGGSREKRFG